MWEQRGLGEYKLCANHIARRRSQSEPRGNEKRVTETAEYFARVAIFRMRVHNANVMNFLISISTILFKHIFHVNGVLVAALFWCVSVWICWKHISELLLLLSNVPPWALHLMLVHFLILAKEKSATRFTLDSGDTLVYTKHGNNLWSYREYWKML